MQGIMHRVTQDTETSFVPDTESKIGLHGITDRVTWYRRRVHQIQEELSVPDMDDR